MNIGVNFFGPKKKMYYDFDGTIEKLIASGINTAELCIAMGSGGEDSEEFKKIRESEGFKAMSGGIWDVETVEEKLKKVREKGMTVVSAHLMMGFGPSPELMASNLEKVRDLGINNNIKYFVISLMKNLDAMKAYVPVLNQYCEVLGEAGIEFAYHNHEMECMEDSGTTVLDYLMENCPKLKLELDVGWAKFAKTCPIEWMKKYRDRLVLLHLKDIKADASPENRDTSFTAVGEGSIPLKEIMKEAQNCPIHEYGVIIDQDDSLTDILDDLAIGADNIKKSME